MVAEFEEAIETEAAGALTEKNVQKRQTEGYFLEKPGIICRNQRRIFFMG